MYCSLKEASLVQGALSAGSIGSPLSRPKVVVQARQGTHSPKLASRKLQVGRNIRSSECFFATKQPPPLPFEVERCVCTKYSYTVVCTRRTAEPRSAVMPFPIPLPWSAMCRKKKKKLVREKRGYAQRNLLAFFVTTAPSRVSREKKRKKPSQRSERGELTGRPAKTHHKEIRRKKKRENKKQQRSGDVD